MSVQAIRADCINNKLALTWTIMGDTEAISIQIASDSEFTDTMRFFVMPKAPGCSLDIGAGLWYFRVGIMWRGKVDWSAIHGPVTVTSPLKPPQLKKTFFSVIHTQPLTGSVRFHTTSTNKPSYTILEYSTESKFLASSTKTRYFEDPARGYVDCEGLDPVYVYNIRLTSTETIKELPTNTIDTLMEWIVFSGKRPLLPTRPHDGQDLLGRRSDTVILKEANESKTPVRFKSQSEYLKYLQARTRNSGHKS